MPIGIKLNKQDIINLFHKEGYTILSNNFNKSKDKILVKCSEGHVSYRTHGGLKQGFGCSECAGNKKYTYKDVCDYFKLQDCLLLSKEYINSKTLLEYLCSCGNKSYISFDNFKNGGKKCRICSYTRSGKARLIAYTDIKKRIEEDGNELLTSEEDYISANKEIVVKCNCGNCFITTFSRYRMRVYQTCVECAISYGSENSRRSKQEIAEILKVYNLELTKYEYNNSKHIIEYMCFCGNHEYVDFARFLCRTKKMCIKCSNNIRFEKQRKYSLKDVESVFKDKKWTLISDKFTSVDSDIDYICNNGHRGKTTLYRLLNGCGCRQCFFLNNTRENHYNWKGGITELRNHLRQQLYDWRIASFEKYDFKCFLSSTNYSLHVHHVNMSFSNIVYEVLDILSLDSYPQVKDYSEKELNSIVELFLEKHREYGCGIPIEHDLHELFHKTYGYINNTYEQFEEYIKRYKNGEFNKLRKAI